MTLHVVSVWMAGDSAPGKVKRQFLVGNNINVSSLVKAIHARLVGSTKDCHLERASDNDQFPLRYTIGKDVAVSGWISTYTERQPQWHIQVDTLPASPFIKVTANGAEELESLIRRVHATFPEANNIATK